VARTHLGASDTFLARLSLDGTGAGDLKYATLLGASYIDEPTGVALDPNNPELVTLSGYSRSWDFPTSPGAWKRAPIFMPDGVPYYSGFLARFRFPASGGGSLVWSSLILGTTTGQFADSVVVDTSGDVIVVGSDIAGTLPTTGQSYKRLPSKGIFLSRFSGDGRNLLYSTRLHGASGVLLLRTKVVSRGPHAVIVAGSTLLPDFPTTAGAFDRVFGSDGTSDGFHRYDGFVARFTLDPNTSSDATAAAPTLVSPSNGATIPLGGALTLDWTDVADPSGVQFYEVEVDMNPDFLAGFTSFQLAAGIYTSSQSVGSTSQEGVFYWRVRMLDRANNFSPWSEVRKFIVGAPIWTNFAATALTPNGVVGGSTAQGTLHIQNVAPAGGQVYTLTSSQPSVASVPPSVTVPAGGSTATFTVTTNSVTVSTPVMITVWSEGNGDHPVLWVDPGSPAPPAPPPPPAAPTLVSPADAATAVIQPITLDWDDVANATSYEVQVDNSSTISAPFTANPTVTASQATLSGGLPAQQLWWRVRARNAAGVFGAFSATRRFTPQAPPPGQAVTLTVTATGRSGERVTSNPAGINVSVGTTGSAPFNTGTSITLSVTNGRDAIWSGACSSGGNKTRTCTFILGGPASVTANVQ
jgi:hypothetical protein